MRINNEVGSILPVECIRRAVQKAGAPALIHTDCVQTFGKVPLRPDKLGVDLMTVTAHKVHGPKGVGALYVRKGASASPVMRIVRATGIRYPAACACRICVRRTPRSKN
ncbi:MAG: hypothetical protein BHV98_01910 [Clostridium sp. CAG:217_53_7]|nr:MAG: hypothetical protein BHV98_01910 [Clostridium sp. CAG:217_53_7]